MRNYVVAATALRDAFDCVVVIVHHSGYDKTHPRGHTSLPAALDAQMSVTRKGERSEAKVEFMKDGKEGDNFTFKLRTVDLCLDDDGDRITSCVVDLVESKPTTPRTMDITAEDMDAAMPPAKPKSGTATRKALDFLEKAIAEKGETGLSNGRIPPDTPVESWKRLGATIATEAGYHGQIPPARGKGRSTAQRMNLWRTSLSTSGMGRCGSSVKQRAGRREQNVFFRQTKPDTVTGCSIVWLVYQKSGGNTPL
jgi:hypothetical protein